MKKLSIFALSYLFAQFANSAGVASTEDALKTPTLGDKSVYSLTDITPNSDFIITKYLEKDGVYTAIDYALSLDTYDWGWLEDSYGNLYLNYTGSVNNSSDLTSYSGTVSKDFSGYTHSYAFTFYDMTLIGGGAIENMSSSISSITGDFVANYLTDKDVTIYDTNGNVVASVDYLFGGAIANASILNSISGSFIGNYVEAYNGTTSAQAGGGAIVNAGGAMISSITGDFIGNYANYYASGAWAGGGAIINTYMASIDSITGDFIGNYATAIDSLDDGVQVKVFGGAINNSEGGQINYITGDFVENYAAAVGDFSRAWGGAIGNDNDATIGSISGDFIGNYVTGSTRAFGGAISSEGTINSITGDFIANYAKGDGEVYGGAIYNEQGSISYIEASFIGNYASVTEETSVAAGGAIYNGVDKGSNTTDTTISFFADTTNIEFTGNYIELNGVKTSNAIYNAAIEAMYSDYYYYDEDNYSAVINFNALSDYSIVLNDGISGASGGIANQILNINTGGSYYVGTVEFNNTVANQTINVNSGTLVLGSFEGVTYGDFYGEGEDLVVVSSSAMLENVDLTVNAGAYLDTIATYLGSTSTITNYGTINLIRDSNDFTNSTIGLENSITSLGNGTVNVYTKLAMYADASLTMSDNSTLNVYGTTSGMLSVGANATLNVILTADNIGASAILDSLYGDSLASVTVYLSISNDLTVELISDTITYIYDDLYDIDSVTVTWVEDAVLSDLYEYLSLDEDTGVITVLAIESGESGTEGETGGLDDNTPSTGTKLDYVYTINTNIDDDDDFCVLEDDVDGETVTSLTVGVEGNPTVEGDVYLVYGDAVVDGDVELNLSGGAFSGDINVVGAEIDADNVYDYEVKGGTVNGNVVVNITGGTFSNDIYAGADTSYSWETGEYAEGTITGDVTVNISGDDINFEKRYDVSYYYTTYINENEEWIDEYETVYSQEDVDAIYAVYQNAIANNGEYSDGYFYYEIDGATISGGDQQDSTRTLNITAYNTTKSDENYFEVEHFDEINITEGSYAYLGFSDDITEDLTINIEDSSTLKSDDVLFIDGESVAVEINVEDGSLLDLAYVNLYLDSDDTASLTVNGDLTSMFLGIWNDSYLVGVDEVTSSSTGDSFIKITGDLTMNANDISVGISDENPSLVYVSGNGLSITTGDIEFNIENSTIYIDNETNQHSSFVGDSIDIVYVDNINWAESVSSDYDFEKDILVYTYDYEYYDNASSFEADDIVVNIEDTTLSALDSDGNLLNINTVKVVGTGSTSTINSLKVNLTNAIVYGDVYAAGAATDGATSTIGDIEVNITGGTFHGDIYAGATDSNTIVTGDININVYNALTMASSASFNLGTNETLNVYGTVDGMITLGAGSSLNVILTTDNIGSDGILSSLSGSGDYTIYVSFGTDLTSEDLSDTSIYYSSSADLNLSIEWADGADSTEFYADATIKDNAIVFSETEGGESEGGETEGGESGTTETPSGTGTDSTPMYSYDSEETGTKTFTEEMSFEGEGDKTGIEVNSDDVVLSGDISASYTTDDEDATLIAIKTNTGNVELEDGTSVSAKIVDSKGNVKKGTALTNEAGSEGLRLNSDGTVYVYGNIITNSPLDVISGEWKVEGDVNTATNDPAGDYITIASGGTLEVQGGEITTGGDTITIDGTLILTTDTNGNLANFVDVGEITVDANGNLEIDASSLSLGATSIIADKDTLSAGDNSTVIEDSISDSGYSYIYDNGSMYFIAAENIDFTLSATTQNESVLANAVNGVSYTTDESTNVEIESFKSEIDTNGLSSYIMNANSYIGEVNTMLLSNVNIANVNRARQVLSQNSGMYRYDSIDDIATDVVTDNSDYTPYSNLAQLQSINFLGSKDSSNGVAGYDYWSVGALANIDAISSEEAIVGVSIGGVYNKVEGDAGDNANSTTFLLNAYAALDLEEYNISLFANIGYSHFWNEGSKSGVGSADWDSDAYSFLVGIAHNTETGIKGLSINTVAMFNVVLLSNDDATYSNDIVVDGEIYASAKLIAGLEVQYAINSKFNSTIRAMYSHEFGDDAYDFSYGTANGYLNNIEYVGAKGGRDSAILGLGLSYDFSETCSAYFDYNAYIYENLTTHGLNLSVGIKF